MLVKVAQSPVDTNGSSRIDLAGMNPIFLLACSFLFTFTINADGDVSGTVSWSWL